MSRPAPRSRGRTVVAVVVVALVVGATVVWWTRAGQPGPAATPSQVTTTTAPVARGTVTEHLQLTGTLDYEGEYPVVHQGDPGILTAAASPGSVIRRGERLYTVGDRRVFLLYGKLPAHREFRLGMTKGPDIRQLERNLVALGLDPDRRIDVDDRFTWATSAAIRRWEADWGVSSWRRTGRLPLGTAVFLPGPLRVGQVRAGLGTTVGMNAGILVTTSTRQVVRVRLTTDRRHLVKPKDKVDIGLPGVRELKGTVTRIGRVATPPQTSAGGQVATVPVTITVELPPGPDLDQAPAQVNIAVRTRENVLTVPVTALLARPSSGYQVRLVSGRVVEVSPGLFDGAAGTVEVSGELTERDEVEVPIR
ncbi:hypothetical protein [Rhizohabitans arisaemae]|uniref:hypothetical protein n=1 Tax=Rhizohabitans arisaemae TaxID=2720610 RepID=UPI0024B16BDD|nr:hypothetical protein [Rhizohabitans arisaemae]